MACFTGLDRAYGVILPVHRYSNIHIGLHINLAIILTLLLSAAFNDQFLQAILVVYQKDSSESCPFPKFMIRSVISIENHSLAMILFMYASVIVYFLKITGLILSLVLIWHSMRLISKREV